jgi:uncharacterized membrane protein
MTSAENREQTTHKRSITKAIIYRGVSVLLVALISYFVTGNFLSASRIAIVFFGVETGLYYVNERIWTNIRWGKETVRDGKGITSAPKSG